MRRGVLLGYFGQQNAGDDAFLRVSDWAVRRYCGVTTALASTPSAPPWGGVVPLWLLDNKPAIWRLKQAFENTLAWRAPHVILAGGSNLHSAGMMTRYIQLVRRAGAGPHFAVGIGVGPFRDAAAESRCGELLNALAFVGCRDRQSFERALGVAPAARIELTGDLAPLLPLVSSEYRRVDGPRRGFGVILCPHERLVDGDTAAEAARFEIVAAGIIGAVRRGSIDEVVLLDLNNHPVKGDAALHDALARRLEGKVPVRRVRYTLDPVQTLSVLAGLKGVLTMRLHGAVFAYCVGTPAVMLAYHEKCYGWAESVGMPNDLVVNASPIDPDALAAALTRITGSDVPILPSLPVEQAQAMALRNWNWLGEPAAGSP